MSLGVVVTEENQPNEAYLVINQEGLTFRFSDQFIW